MVFGAPWRDFKHSSAIENAENWRQRVTKEELALGVHEVLSGDDGRNNVLPGGTVETRPQRLVPASRESVSACSSVSSAVSSMSAANCKIEQLQRRIAEQRAAREGLKAKLGRDKVREAPAAVEAA